jgi:hypothetical protein
MNRAKGIRLEKCEDNPKTPEEKFLCADLLLSHQFNPRGFAEIIVKHAHRFVSLLSAN